jgi:hypothetical protein
MFFLSARRRYILGPALALGAACLPVAFSWGISPGMIPFPASPEAMPAVARGVSPGAPATSDPLPLGNAPQIVSPPVAVGPPIHVPAAASPTGSQFASPAAHPSLPSAEIVKEELCKRRSCWDKLCHRLPQPEISDLANLMDDLEREMFRYGSVAVKSADVWTQNRMTKFRGEYEQEMLKNLSLFRPTLSARQRQADIATLTSATAIGAAMPTSASTTARRGGTVNQVSVPVPAATATLAALPLDGSTPLLGTAGTPTTPGNAAANVILGLQGALPGTATTEAIGLEPTIVLDEHSRYLLHLQQLRRVNTGDDKAEMPGYGLYLLRMPVSLLPGPDSFKGKGASVTVQASHQLPPDLLPGTFRDFVTNDLAAVLAPVIADILDNDLIRTLKGDELRELVVLTQLEAGVGAAGLGAKDVPAVVQASLQVPAAPPATGAVPTPTAPRSSQTYRTLVAAPEVRREQFVKVAKSIRPPSGTTPAGPGRLKASVGSEVDEIYGSRQLLLLAASVKEAREKFAGRDFSIRDWLRGEIKGAYDYMRANSHDSHFVDSKVDEIGRLIVARSYNNLASMRDTWLTTLPGYGEPVESATVTLADRPGRIAYSRTLELLAYGIVVEQYLLDVMLKDDMRRFAMQKGCLPGHPEGEAFYSLNPSASACTLYNAYVATKWPVHVFAIDPVVDQQNVQDISSVRRELQIALAVGVSTGQVNMNTALNYARRLEIDIETIGLNRTAVGFGAGDQTFGWKFYPRVQTAQRESNPRAIADLLLFNGPGPFYDVRHRKIEPGQRECTALVVMPTFVPYLRLNTTVNWFGLIGHCAKQVLDTKDMLSLGQKVQLAKGALAHFSGSCCYRPTDLEGLSARVDQLEAQLPIQSQLVEFPYENTLPGSEVFIEGYSHLAPQLNDWYGAPASSRDFTVFLSGHHFSVHETKVIAGGVAVAPDKFVLLSRDLMQVTVPANAVVENRTVQENDKQTGQLVTRVVPTIDVHVASPNGPSNHLLIELPALEPKPCPVASGLRWSLPTVYSARYTFPTASPAFAFVAGESILPPTSELVIEAPPSYFPAPAGMSLVVTVTSGGKVIYNTSDAVTKATLSFDPKRNAFYMLGGAFKALSDDMIVAVQAALNAKPASGALKPPSEPLVISAKLVIGSVVYPLDNQLTVGLVDSTPTKP